MSVARNLDWRPMLVFAALGPLVGVAPILLSIAVSGEAVPNFKLFGILLTWAYLFGVVPAAVTGLLFPSATSLFSSTPQAKWLQFVVAPLLGFLVSWLLFAALTPFSAVRLAALGAASALVCAFVCRLLGVGPNNSSKPTPLRGAA